MRKYTIKTLGCKVNQFESAALSQSLRDSGFTSVETNEADLCIINTCTVTGKASMQSRQAIRQAIRSNPNARIVVTGCYAQTEPEKIKQINGVDDIVLNPDKHKISKLVKLNDLKNISPIDLDELDTNHHHDFFNSIPPLFEHRTRPFLKIQDGCDAFCTYCIVPYARGPNRSMPFDVVLKNIKQLIDSGNLEIVLTGIHLGSYGLDLEPKKSLFELLFEVNKIDTVTRLRFSSIEPNEISNDIINLVKSSNIFCNHFHIPLQSGNDDILKKMNRPYSRSFFNDLVRNIHESLPDVSIGVDIIIGFPGETEKAFEDTYTLISELPVSYLHVFPFSSRQGTPAAKFPEKVTYAMIKARSRQMRNLGNNKKRVFYKKFIGKTVEVLIESNRDKKTGRLKGLTSNYIPVLINGPETLKNKLVHARIEKLTKDIMMEGKLKE